MNKRTTQTAVKAAVLYKHTQFKYCRGVGHKEEALNYLSKNVKIVFKQHSAQILHLYIKMRQQAAAPERAAAQTCFD